MADPRYNRGHNWLPFEADTPSAPVVTALV